MSTSTFGVPTGRGWTDYDYRKGEGGTSVYHTVWTETDYTHVHAIISPPQPGVDHTIEVKDDGAFRMTLYLDGSNNTVTITAPMLERIVDLYNEAERVKAEAAECAKHGCNGDHSKEA